MEINHYTMKHCTLNCKKKWDEVQLQSTFFKLVQSNQVSKIRDLLHDSALLSSFGNNTQHIVNFFVLKKSGDTSLHICARLGPEYFQLLKYLVEEEGANIEGLNNEGKTPLHDAAQFSNLVTVQYLIQRGANVNVLKRADWTPLMLACTKQDVQVVNLLLTSGADLNFVNKDGWNCVHIAAREGNVEIVKLLLGQKSCQSLAKTKSRNGRRPLHTAVMHGHWAVTQLLVEHYCSNPEEINCPDNCGSTPVMEACRFGHYQLLEYLFKMGGGNLLHQVNGQGQNCLHIASEAGQVDMIYKLVQRHGMDVNQPAEDDTKLGPIHWAAKEGHADVIKALIELNALPSLRDGKGRTVPDIAKMFGHYHCIIPD